MLADGTAWIWAAAAVSFPKATGVLDSLRASQHLAAAANAVHGEGTAAAAEWLQRGRRRLLADGWQGLCDHVAATLAGELTGRPGRGSMSWSAISPGRPSGWATSAGSGRVAVSAAARWKGSPGGWGDG